MMAPPPRLLGNPPPSAEERLLAIYVFLIEEYGDDPELGCVGVATPCPACGGPLHFHPRLLACTRCDAQVEG